MALDLWAKPVKGRTSKDSKREIWFCSHILDTFLPLMPHRTCSLLHTRLVSESLPSLLTRLKLLLLNFSHIFSNFWHLPASWDGAHCQLMNVSLLLTGVQLSITRLSEIYSHRILLSENPPSPIRLLFWNALLHSNDKMARLSGCRCCRDLNQIWCRTRLWIQFVEVTPGSWCCRKWLPFPPERGMITVPCGSSFTAEVIGAD